MRLKQYTFLLICFPPENSQLYANSKGLVIHSFHSGFLQGVLCRDQIRMNSIF